MTLYSTLYFSLVVSVAGTMELKDFSRGKDEGKPVRMILIASINSSSELIDLEQRGEYIPPLL